VKEKEEYRKENFQDGQKTCAFGEVQFRDFKKNSWKRLWDNELYPKMLGRLSEWSAQRSHRQRKVNKFRGFTMQEHCAYALVALHNAPHHGLPEYVMTLGARRRQFVGDFADIGVFLGVGGGG
jgi:hypothetical protein